ncbi:hypothetical protein AW27_033200 [Streptomyces sp. PCS3-D2]|uniref:hypothetical protein n=1 Tax=Streptomyces sp. PCS3-D2 TaxID=1460244 RepID=UPI0004532E20|nr:hypothetical protein [Streptomyces sp. PCS3-D2]WKV75952.1 hypothetical protein AW27_033200 [Streptomyces sp. PCS3-D2]
MTGEEAAVATTTERDAPVVGLRGGADEGKPPLLARAAARAAVGGLRRTAVRRLFEPPGSAPSFGTAGGATTATAC